MASRFDLAYEHILEQITHGRWSPGDVLNRRAIAAELGVSVSPVGEAMLQLELEGVLETLPRKGTRVRRPTHQDVWGLLITRIAIECQAIRMICGAQIVAAQERLTALARAVDAAPAGGPLMIRADVAFHRALVMMTECPSLLWHYDRLARQGLLLLRSIRIPAQRRMNHVQLVRDLCTEDPSAAEAAMREHIQSGKASLALERGLYEETEPMRLGRSPISTHQRMGRSMQHILATSSD